MKNSSERYSDPARELQNSVEALANLVYLARRSSGDTARGQYLDRAATILFELRDHPSLNGMDA